MTVRELIEALMNISGDEGSIDREVILSSDSEGNSFATIAGIDEEIYQIQCGEFVSIHPDDIEENEKYEKGVFLFPNN